MVVVQVTLSAGRTREQKQRFYARLVALLEQRPGVRSQDVVINLVEDTRDDWSFGSGEAQYIVLPKEQWR